MNGGVDERGMMTLAYPLPLRTVGQGLASCEMASGVNAKNIIALKMVESG